jgi:hypothetical protein
MFIPKSQYTAGGRRSVQHKGHNTLMLYLSQAESERGTSVLCILNYHHYPLKFQRSLSALKQENSDIERIWKKR